jgi:hypothetical protein
LRAEGIPTGLCYQRLAKDASGSAHSLHGLVAVFLNGAWRREDACGNKLGVNAQFSLSDEQLAYTVDPNIGERDYPTLYIAPARQIVAALRSATNILVLCENGLPSAL